MTSALSKNNQHFLSLIIPVFKQEKTIINDLTAIRNTLERTRYDYEIIAVIDGRSYDRSFEFAKTLKTNRLKVYAYKFNHGKGYALRYGMARAKGDYIAFIDSGMEIDPNGISMVMEHMEWYNADIIVASKRHPASIVNYPLNRKIISFGAYLVAYFLLGIRLHDTQAGLKIFKRKVLEKVLPRLLVKNYAIDLEILSVANHLGFNRIYEAPIKLNYSFQSLTHAAGFKIIYHSLIDALAIFYRLRIKKYYDDHNHRSWVYDHDLEMRVNTGL